jgi:hypothetical protein
MRLAYNRHAGERGFTPEQFRAAADEVAGGRSRGMVPTGHFIDRGGGLLGVPRLFGLRFATPKETEKTEDLKKTEAAAKWNLQVRPEASGAQKEHLKKLLEHARSQ